ncbi:MAG: hypothetical protein DYG98_16005 [Haliscomenobacteraceae bacterium CHB4]|nr:hypothetical protein [Haliscomenobacteraceae bacterium CHB4]
MGHGDAVGTTGAGLYGLSSRAGTPGVGTAGVAGVEGDSRATTYHRAIGEVDERGGCDRDVFAGWRACAASVLGGDTNGTGGIAPLDRNIFGALSADDGRVCGDGPLIGGGAGDVSGAVCLGGAAASRYRTGDGRGCIGAGLGRNCEVVFAKGKPYYVRQAKGQGNRYEKCDRLTQRDSG